MHVFAVYRMFCGLSYNCIYKWHALYHALRYATASSSCIYCILTIITVVANMAKTGEVHGMCNKNCFKDCADVDSTGSLDNDVTSQLAYYINIQLLIFPMQLTNVQYARVSENMQSKQLDIYSMCSPTQTILRVLFIQV